MAAAVSMSKLHPVFLGLLLAPLHGWGIQISNAEPDFAQMMAWEQRNLAALHCNIDRIREYSAKRNVIFVGGLWNEIYAPVGYLSGNVTAVKEIGARSASRYLVSSFASAEDNADFIAEHLREVFFENGKQPIVLIGHSLGGNEALLAVLRHPNLVTDGIVESVVALQAPLEGVPAAGRVPTWVPMIPAYRSLTPAEALSSVSASLSKLTASQRKSLDRAIYHVRSAVSGRVGDGIVNPPSPGSPRIGRDLGVLEGNHFEFVYPVSQAGQEKQRAFIQALFRKLASSAAGAPAGIRQVCTPEEWRDRTRQAWSSSKLKAKADVTSASPPSRPSRSSTAKEAR
jgi:pimeloyl-ACP methyl ester carboxylesterase